jgi:hypothetical protein
MKVDGREAPIRAATVRERMPAAESANAPSRSRLCLAVGYLDQGPPGCSEMETHCVRNAAPQRRLHAVGLPAK